MAVHREPIHDVEKTITKGMMGYVAYVLLVTKTPKWDKEAKLRVANLAQHINYFVELEKKGKVIFAGPFIDDPDRPDGMIILKVKSAEEAREIADGDIFHKMGFRSFTIRPWLINEGGFDLRVSFSTKSFELL